MPAATPVTVVAASAPRVSAPAPSVMTLPEAVGAVSSVTALTSACATGTLSTIRTVSVPAAVASAASVTLRAMASRLSTAPGWFSALLSV